MERSAEFPDQHVVCIGEQFFDAAELLLKNVPAVVAPSALRACAAFSIELFIKSLNSHWVDHPELDGLESFIVTTKSNTKGHHLAKLFAQLPEPVKDEISSRFADDPLARKHSSLEQALSLYAETFEIERYGFEQADSRQYESRCVSEIVDLARFFRDYVASVPMVRY